MSRDYDSKISSATKFCHAPEFCRNLINASATRKFVTHSNPKDGAVFASSAATLNTSNGDVEVVVAGSLECLATEETLINKESIFNAGSISKPFAAATLLRMKESDFVTEYGKYFPYGLNTKVSSFLDYLKERYPDSNYIQSQLEEEPNFANISLLNLLNHTSGLGDFDPKDFAKLRFESPESLAKEPDGKAFTLKRKDPRPNFGDFSYSNLGYELLGMIISAIGSAEHGSKRTYGDMLMDNVILPLDLGNTFAPDVIANRDGKVVALGMEDEKPIVQAKDLDPQSYKLIPSQVFRRSCGSATAVYSTPTDVCKFFHAFLSDRDFIKLNLLNIPTTPTAIESEHYGLGYFVNKEHEQSPKFYHGAFTVGFFGHVRFDPEKRRVACCLNATQNATTAFLSDGDIPALKSKVVCEATDYNEEIITKEVAGMALVKASTPKTTFHIVGSKEFEEKMRGDRAV